LEPGSQNRNSGSGSHRNHRPSAAILITAFVAAVADAAPKGYVEPVACRPCHQAIYDRYIETPMGRSFQLPNQSRDLADWNGAGFYHEGSDQHFEMFRRGDTRYVRRFRLADGRRADTLERKVTHIMGSGERALSLLHQTPEGRIYELPVSWYSQERAWAMAPGYDRRNHAGFNRQVNHKCMFCHNGYLDVPPVTSRTGWDADVLFPQQLPLGIDCQRCHGPGEKHVASRNPADVVNPAKLSPERSLEVCMQCHYETTTFRLPESLRRFQRSFYSYKPGEPLGDYIVHFDHAPRAGHDDKFEIVSAAYRLRQSRCFTESGGRMTCVTCHNPHAGSGRISAKCSTCHKSVDAHPPADTRDCTSCHMPKRRTEDVVHVVMTDHKIVRRPQPGNHLAQRREKTDAEQTYRGEVVQVYPLPKPADEVYAAIAQIKEKANLEPGIRRLEAALRKNRVNVPEPLFELADALRVIGRDKDAEKAYLSVIRVDAEYPQAWNNLANLLADSGRRREAIEAYHQALKLTPWHANVHVNLGLTLLEQGRSAEARQAFESAVKANPSSADAHANLGALLLSLGQTQQARFELEAALALDPNHTKARNNLAIAHHRN
jgi:Flp pilus assembly protein TadD